MRRAAWAMAAAALAGLALRPATSSSSTHLEPAPCSVAVQSAKSGRYVEVDKDGALGTTTFNPAAPAAIFKVVRPSQSTIDALTRARRLDLKQPQQPPDFDTDTLSPSPQPSGLPSLEAHEQLHGSSSTYSRWLVWSPPPPPPTSCASGWVLLYSPFAGGYVSVAAESEREEFVARVPSDGSLSFRSLFHLSSSAIYSYSVGGYLNLIDISEDTTAQVVRAHDGGEPALPLREAELPPSARLHLRPASTSHENTIPLLHRMRCPLPTPSFDWNLLLDAARAGACDATDAATLRLAATSAAALAAELGEFAEELPALIASYRRVLLDPRWADILDLQLQPCASRVDEHPSFATLDTSTRTLRVDAERCPRAAFTRGVRPPSHGYGAAADYRFDMGEGGYFNDVDAEGEVRGLGMSRLEMGDTNTTLVANVSLASGGSILVQCDVVATRDELQAARARESANVALVDSFGAEDGADEGGAGRGGEAREGTDDLLSDVLVDGAEGERVGGGGTDADASEYEDGATDDEKYEEGPPGRRLAEGLAAEAEHIGGADAMEGVEEEDVDLGDIVDMPVEQNLFFVPPMGEDGFGAPRAHADASEAVRASAAAAGGGGGGGKTVPTALSVLMLVVDATSRSHMQRMCPRSLAALDALSGSGARVYELDRYSIVGYNSIPNTVPLISGVEESVVAEPSLSYGAPKSVPTPIWTEFKQHGAATFVLEEIHDGCKDIDAHTTSAASKLYSSHAAADQQPDFGPWEVFCRPEVRSCCTERASFLRPGRRQCINGADLHVEMLAYARRFLDQRAAAGGRSFGLLNLMTAHEHFMTRLAGLDDDLAAFIEGLRPRLADDTALVLLADHGTHGIWYNDFAIGQAEHRNPTLHLVLPSRFVKANPAVDAALRANRERRVTTYDLHATLRHLANWPAMPRPVEGASSIFVELEANRSCQAARIPIAWCMRQHSSCSSPLLPFLKRGVREAQQLGPDDRS